MVQHYEVVDLMGYIFNTCDGFPISGHFNGEDEVIEYETFGGVGWAAVGLCLNKAVSSLRQNPVDGPNQSQQAPGLVYPLVPFGN